MSTTQKPQLDSDVTKVRGANAKDVPSLVLLNEHVQGLHAGLYPADFIAHPNTYEVTRFFSSLVNAEKHFIGIFESPEGAVGYIWFEELERSASPFMNLSRLLHIHQIAVKADARWQGVGSALMSWADHHARASGIPQISVEHWAGNEDARRFFSSRGFQPVRITMRKPVSSSD